MSVRRLSKTITPLSLGLALLVSGCEETKRSQCERLIKTIREGTSLVQSRKGYQVTTSLKLAKDLEKVANNLENLNLQDSKLQEFRSSFAGIFKSMSQEVNKAGKALGASKVAKASKPGREKIRKARQDIKLALNTASKYAKESDSLEIRINKYCKQIKEAK